MIILLKKGRLYSYQQKFELGIVQKYAIYKQFRKSETVPSGKKSLTLTGTQLE